MEIRPHYFQLKLKSPFRIAHGIRHHQDTLIIEISRDGQSGFGEAAAISYYHITVEGMIEKLNEVQQLVSTKIFPHPIELWHFLNEFISDNTFLQCALDVAAWDLYGKLENKSLSSLWQTEISSYPITNYTIGIDSIEEMKKKIHEFPWPVYKIKLGTEEDVRIIKELRKITDSVFRVDANCAWSVHEAISNCKAFKDLGVEFVEQPLKAGDWEGMKELYYKSELPLIADESCQKLEDVEKCHNHFHGINIKLMKCGGITPALEMIREARAKNLKVMMGCMTESSIGISAIAQFAPQLDYVDLDGAMLISNDPGEGVKIEKNGKLIFPDYGGTGAKLKNHYL
jgi:L-Ala-D/L-Glu epimerase